MQDWVFEVSDPTRINEFISLLASAELSEDERFTLMDITIQSFEDLNDEPTSDERWHALLTIVRTHFQIHADQVRYWAVVDEPVESAFNVSESLRTLYRECTSAT